MKTKTDCTGTIEERDRLIQAEAERIEREAMDGLRRMARMTPEELRRCVRKGKR